ncbi:MAG TPA: hypothetical protein VM662_16675 [Sphingomonas sp.]|nr:hypothetical protein [Sphingomonas sp.]
MKIPGTVSLKATGIACALSLAIGGVAGWKLHDGLIHQPHLRADSNAALAAEKAARAAEGKGATIATEIRDAHDVDQAEIRTVTQTIIKEVPRYVSSNVKCPAVPASSGAPAQPERVAVADVSVGFGLLHDAAALGNPPAPPGPGVDLDAPRGTGMPAVASTIVANYGMCHAWRAEAAAWRDWYERERAAWPVK